MQSTHPNLTMFSFDKIHFEISERKVLLRLFDVFFVFLALYFTGKLVELNYFSILTSNFNFFVILAVYINLFGTIFEMYNLQVASNQFQVLKSTLLTSSITVLFFLLTPILSPFLPNRRIDILLLFLVVLFALILWRIFYVHYLASYRFVQKIVLICNHNQVEELISGLANIDPHYRIVGFVSTDENEDLYAENKFLKHIKRPDLFAYVKENYISEIVISSQKTEGMNTELYQQLLQLLESGTSIREYNQVYESKTQRIPIQLISKDFYRFFPFSRSNHNKLYLIIIRVLEILFSFLGLIFGALILPFIILGNIIGNKGCLFYTQDRVGKDGKVFAILKLRTMILNAEINGAVFTTTNDSRVTAFGKFLRKTRIDELPQFLNVLKGDMAVIGPRPERPFFVSKIAALMPFYETRHIIRPGLTGWAQVNYSYGETTEDSLMKLQYDLFYIKHRSISLDLNIVIKTLTTVFFYRGQ